MHTNTNRILLTALLAAFVTITSGLGLAQTPKRGYKDVFSGPPVGSPAPVVPGEPTPDQVTVLVSLLTASRSGIVAPHEGINPFPWVRQFQPKTADDARALLGLAQLLANPDLSSTDLENTARDIIRGNIKVGKFFGF